MPEDLEDITAIIDHYRVSARSIWKSDSGSPIMIQNPRGPGQTGYWDDPVKSIPKNGINLHFIEFFNWNWMAVQDFRYYRVSVARFEQHPHLVGLEALIETHYARVLFAAEAEKP